MSMGKTLLSLCLPQSVKLGADTGGPGQQGKNFNKEGEERLSFWTEFCGHESDCSLLHL